MLDGSAWEAGKIGDSRIQRAVTRVGLPADPLGRDTRDFLTCAVGIADASLNGTARLAAIEEIGRVDAAGAGGAKILLPDLTPLRLLGLAGGEMLDLLFLTGADVWLVDTVRDDILEIPDTGPDAVRECGAILNTWLRRNDRKIRIQETDRGIENRKALKVWVMAGSLPELKPNAWRHPVVVMTGDPDVPSPCVVRCSLSEDRLHCPECLRTLEEIRHWRHMAPEQKKAVLERIEAITGQKFVLIAPGRVARLSGKGEGVDPFQLIDAVRKASLSGNHMIVPTDDRGARSILRHSDLWDRTVVEPLATESLVRWLAERFGDQCPDDIWRRIRRALS
jgi:predicted Fe-S protein YdhL (DUF1289 family)